MELMLEEIDRAPLPGPAPLRPSPSLIGACGDLAGCCHRAADHRRPGRLLRTDNVAERRIPGLADLGIAPTTLEAVLPTYLYRYRKGGQYADQEDRALAT